MLSDLFLIWRDLSKLFRSSLIDLLSNHGIAFFYYFTLSLNFCSQSFLNTKTLYILIYNLGWQTDKKGKTRLLNWLAIKGCLTVWRKGHVECSVDQSSWIKNSNFHIKKNNLKIWHFMFYTLHDYKIFPFILYWPGLESLLGWVKS